MPLSDDGTSSTVFVLGGSVRDGVSGNVSLVNDVWETFDGRAWTQHKFEMIWTPRAFFGAVARGPQVS